MPSLAFDRHGKPFTFHAHTRKLLVRLFRNPARRGTCCAVQDVDGEQLYLDVDADYQEFRHAVGSAAGVYRLDQCDGKGTQIAGAPPAYVSIEPSRTLAPIAGLDPRDELIRELAHRNADMAKTAIAQNATMMRAAADVLRAYLPHPPPPSLPPPQVPTRGDVGDENDDENGDDENGDDEVGDDKDNEGASASPSRWRSCCGSYPRF